MDIQIHIEVLKEQYMHNRLQRKTSWRQGKTHHRALTLEYPMGWCGVSESINLVQLGAKC